MHGFLKMPKKASLSEKEEYKKYMCLLCDSLHQNYGLRARLFVNYDCTTLALLIGGLDESLRNEVLSKPERKKRCCLLKPRESSPKVFDFVSALSIMLGYSKYLDKAIEEGKRMPKRIDRLADSASIHLLKNGLDKPFFERMVKVQHAYEEGGCEDIETLSLPTSEIVSRIFCVAGGLAGRIDYFENLKKLGQEVGRMIYVYDGLLDYHQDLKNNSFNCIRTCYFRDGFNGRKSIALEKVSGEISNLLQDTENNISVILDEMEFTNVSFIKKIFLKNLEGKQGRCEICNKQGLLKQKVYSLLALQAASTSDENFCDLICNGCCSKSAKCSDCCCFTCPPWWYENCLLKSFDECGWFGGIVAAIMQSLGALLPVCCCCAACTSGKCCDFEGCEPECAECCGGEPGIPVRPAEYCEAGVPVRPARGCSCR